MGAMEATLTTFTASDGTSLYYEWWLPDAPKAILVVVHGLGDHSGRYGPLIRFFAQHNIGVCLYDMRGHGRSGGVRGHFDRMQTLLSDLAVFLKLIQQRSTDVPLFLIGHSFGGLVALNYVVRFSKQVAGLLLSSPCIKPLVEIANWKKALSRKAHRFLPRLKVDGKIDPHMLSHDPDVVSRYMEDDLVVRQFSVKVGHELLKAVDIVMALAPRIYVPSMFMHAGEDAICDKQATRQFYSRVSVGCKTFRVFENMYHELFNEIGKDEVFATMLGWIEAELNHERPVRMVSDSGISEVKAGKKEPEDQWEDRYV